MSPVRTILGVRSGHILVVDDQIELAENIAEVLQGLGFETDVASSAEEALAIIRRGGVTAVVTDFKLPGKSGADLIGDIRRAGERIPALMMSAYTDEQTIAQSHAAGAWLFLPKPVPLDVLMETFRSLAKTPAAALVIDDEAGFAENLAEALSAGGHEVIVSQTAADALAQHRRLETAVVDYRLPDATGIDVARALRARDPAIRILFISGFADELRSRLATELPGSEAMEKPVDTRSVIAWLAHGPKSQG
jgi:DNA-binding NtrC family response regulator